MRSTFRSTHVETAKATMTSTHPTLCTVRPRGLRHLTAAAVFTLWGLLASPAQATLVATSALRSVSADDTVNTAVLLSTTSTAGNFNETAASTFTPPRGVGISAFGAQNTHTDANLFRGVGLAEIHGGGAASALYSVNFTLDEAIDYTLFATLGADGGSLFSAFASITLFQSGVGAILAFDASTPDLDIAGTLAAGSYVFAAQAQADAAAPDAGGESIAAFRFDLSFLPRIDVDVVPEPGSMLLGCLGLLICSGFAPRRSVGRLI
jgi:hypothetical protein